MDCVAQRAWTSRIGGGKNPFIHYFEQFTGISLSQEERVTQSIIKSDETHR
jgi:hypothetical protein